MILLLMLLGAPREYVVIPRHEYGRIYRHRVESLNGPVREYVPRIESSGGVGRLPEVNPGPEWIENPFCKKPKISEPKPPESKHPLTYRTGMKLSDFLKENSKNGALP